MSILETIIYSIIGISIVIWLVNKLFIKPRRKNKINKAKEEQNKVTEND